MCDALRPLVGDTTQVLTDPRSPVPSSWATTFLCQSGFSLSSTSLLHNVRDHPSRLTASLLCTFISRTLDMIELSVMHTHNACSSSIISRRDDPGYYVMTMMFLVTGFSDGSEKNITGTQPVRVLGERKVFRGCQTQWTFEGRWNQFPRFDLPL